MTGSPATIRDVAKAAQLSVASISRVLNNQSNVHPDTRQRVLAAVQALGYVPNAAARSLSMARSHAIGVVLPDLHGEFFSEMMRGMDAVASARGYLLLLANMHADPQLTADDLRLALPATLPTVLVNSRLSDAHHGLRVDNAAGVTAMLDHLLALGCRRVVHLAGPAANLDAHERSEAYRVGLAARLPGVPPRVLDGDFRETGGERLVAGLIAAGEPFDAILAANDMMALGALHALRAAGREAGVAVAGFDDIPLARFVGLTAMRVDVAGIGSRVIARLLDQIAGTGAPPGQERVVPELVVRASTGRAADG